MKVYALVSLAYRLIDSSIAGIVDDIARHSFRLKSSRLHSGERLLCIQVGILKVRNRRNKMHPLRSAVSAL